MRAQFEFRLHTIAGDDAALGTVDPTLELLGMQGWELRGITTLGNGTVIVALQRPVEETTVPLGGDALEAVLSDPNRPPLEVIERELQEPDVIA